MSDISRPDYWEDVYRTGETRWDKGRASPPLVRLVREGVIPAGAKVAVPGAGRGHDALFLAKEGFRVTALDFAPSAAAAMREAAAAAKVEMEVLQEDVFALAKRFPAGFDAIVEHTIFCAIDPPRRREFVEAMHGALRAGGIWLGLFYAHGREGGPPHTTDEAEVRKLASDLFTVERIAVAPDSFPERSGNELEFVFRKKQ